MTVHLIRFRVCFLWVLDILVCVTEGEFDKSHVAKPLTSGLKLLLTFLELCTHSCSDLSLQLHIDLRNEKLVEMCSAHRASHSGLNNPLMALEAQEVLAGGENGLSTELKADRTLIIIPLSTFDPVSLTDSALGGSS